ncbi:MAG: HNH endonuclease signature motif containing protein [Thaumarchaeota archaeon]|nr:HNH endonuclease signature motif containing protein [Nitrososphaerota archaeon]
MTGKYRTDHTWEDPRRSRRTPPLWMAINRYHNHCWCGKPKELWQKGMRKYCCKTHTDWWFENICPMWSQVRLWIIKRDSAKCVKCGKSGIHGNSSLNPYLLLHVDHITPHAAGGDFWDEKNLQVLCENCHKIKTLQDIKIIQNAKMSNGMFPLDLWNKDV